LEGIARVLSSRVTVSLRGQGTPNSTQPGILVTQRTSDDIWCPSRKKPDFAKIDELINDNHSRPR
jgi:hypothetical protein